MSVNLKITGVFLLAITGFMLFCAPVAFTQELTKPSEQPSKQVKCANAPCPTTLMNDKNVKHIYFGTALEFHGYDPELAIEPIDVYFETALEFHGGEPEKKGIEAKKLSIRLGAKGKPVARVKVNGVEISAFKLGGIVTRDYSTEIPKALQRVVTIEISFPFDLIVNGLYTVSSGPLYLDGVHIGVGQTGKVYVDGEFIDIGNKSFFWNFQYK